MLRLALYRGKWAATWHENGNTKRVSLRTSDRAIAEQRLLDLKPDVVGESVADAMQIYLDRNVGRGSHEAMRYSWKALEPTFGAVRPEQISEDLCKKYATQRRESGVSDGTIIKDLGVLRAAVKRTGKPAKFWFPPQPEPLDRYLTREEFERLLTQLKFPHLKLAAILFLTTACRSEALLQLTWDRVDFERGRIRLRAAEQQATNKGRAIVPMNGRARTALEQAYKARQCNYVISWAGHSVGSIKKGFETACRALKWDDVTPRTLRHTAAVWMAEAGVPMSEIAQFLGHRNDRITQRVYARFSPDYLQKAAGALE